MSLGCHQGVIWHRDDICTVFRALDIQYRSSHSYYYSPVQWSFNAPSDLSHHRYMYLKEGTLLTKQDGCLADFLASDKINSIGMNLR